MSLFSNFLEKNNIKTTLAESDDFEKWMINDAWDKYQTYCMEQRTLIMNKINGISIIIPNETIVHHHLYCLMILLMIMSSMV